MCVGGEDGGVFLSFLLDLQGASAHLKNQDKTADEFEFDRIEGGEGNRRQE